jgi:hypothetical protein
MKEKCLSVQDYQTYVKEKSNECKKYLKKENLKPSKDNIKYFLLCNNLVSSPDILTGISINLKEKKKE